MELQQSQIQEQQYTQTIEKNTVIKNCAPFTDCISEINNTQIDNAKDIDTVMPVYIVIIIPKHLEVYGNTIEINHF